MVLSVWWVFVQLIAWTLLGSAHLSCPAGTCDADAINIIQKVAAYNRTTSTLTFEKQPGHDTSSLWAFRRDLAKLSSSHVRGLFATRRLAPSASLLIVICALIELVFLARTLGMGVYSTQVILSVIGVPGALLAGGMVELLYLGRWGTLAVSADVRVFKNQFKP
ncbi:hypothetical protein FIBSPDRAFT_1023957 [Athelia psychrophila]|uniref:Uncharacterized protein n=1 Tax=Athelia psychrophila TaxID=1759441 RepID=A0A166IKM5_9AGAM|nr:hypothetical protein FIBSPDRAFT_1023957 [Fibularhizoctonia sp. CBS 109695]